METLVVINHVIILITPTAFQWPVPLS